MTAFFFLPELYNLSMESQKPERLYFKTYLQMIRNSAGTAMFRNLYLSGQNGTESDAMTDGAYSCAFFVSSVLTLFKQNSGFHGTIQSTLADIAEHGWEEVSPGSTQPGDLLVWEPMEFEGQMHGHIGFYLGGGRAVSTSYKAKTVKEHEVESGGRRLTQVFRQTRWE